MKPALAIPIVIAGLLFLPVPLAQNAETEGEERPLDEAEPPVDLGTSERTTVRLVLVDVVVIDRQERTVAGLTAEDFQVFERGRPVAVDTLDVDCGAGAAEEPDSVRFASAREAPAAGGASGKIVLAFDYLHLDMLQREDALDQAMQLVKNGGTGDEEIMLAALNGGLRVEQVFAHDRQAVLHSLQRMHHDITLWNGNFSHLTEIGFVEGLTALFDVLGTVPGPKAVVLYSAMRDVPLDLQFEKLAAVASTSRCSVYPVDANGLTTPGLQINRPMLPG